MKIKVKVLNKMCLPNIIKKGDWIDLKSSARVELNKMSIKYGEIAYDKCLIPLGVAMELPKGCEAIIAPRSSLFLKHGIILWNSIGIIDNSYNGDTDEWSFGALAFNDTVISEGERICQFRIQLSQKATIWQKLKWIFSRKITFQVVDKLYHNNRGGYGSSGNF